MVRIVSVVGNIGSGKSTLVAELAARYRGGDGGGGRVVTLLEPIAEWTAPALEDGSSMLGAFYHDPERTALAFQTYVLVTRLKQIESALSAIGEADDSDNVLVLVERGPWFDLDLMARPMFASGMLSAMEWAVYVMLNDVLVSRLPRVDAVVYLRAEVADCATRIATRARADEEGHIDTAYLTAVHDSHDAYFTRVAAADVQCVQCVRCVRCVRSSSDTPPGDLADSLLAWFAETARSPGV